MMKFRTEIEPGRAPFTIDHKHKMLFTGSCFTDNIGRRLEDLRFRVSVNPFGVVYNPLSVGKTIDLLLERKEYTAGDLGYFNELWFSWDHHSSFSGTSRDHVLSRINHSLEEASDLLYRADYLLITFGTAWVYRLKDTGRVVCNCHKMPASEFHRELLKPEDIFASCSSMISGLLAKNPEIKIIFTISPVRHWKDGATGNQVSKASLILAVNWIVNAFPDITTYFPAYELMLDDLRDYRFYADDLLHPNQQAIDYIWDKFSKSFFSTETLALNREIESLLKAVSHRPVTGATEGHRRFLAAQEKKTLDLAGKYPTIDFSPFLTAFGSPGNS